MTSLNTYRLCFLLWFLLTWRERGVGPTSLKLKDFWVNLELKKKKRNAAKSVECWSWFWSVDIETKFGSPVPCEKIYLWYPQISVLKELRWQAVFTGCGCISSVYCRHDVLAESYRLSHVGVHGNHEGKSRHLFEKAYNSYLKTDRYAFTARMR